MFCESYRQPLTEAAVRGEVLSGASRLHVARCEACQEALSKEQALLRAIDGALRTSANAEVPTSLLPRVRAQVAVNSGKTSWRTPVLVFAAALLVAGILVLSPGLHWPSTQRPTGAKESAHAAPIRPAVSDGVGESSAAPKTKVKRPSQVPGKVFVAAVRTPFRSEVLVSPEEQAGLDHYATRWRTWSVNDSAPATAVGDGDPEIRPLEIAEIDVKQLTIDPLGGESN